MKKRVFIITDGNQFQMFDGGRSSRVIAEERPGSVGGNPYMIYGRAASYWADVEMDMLTLTVARVQSGQLV